MWKCRRKEVYDCCSVEFIIQADPQKNPTFKGVPEWVHEAFRKGVLKIENREAAGAIPYLKNFSIPQDCYIVRVGDDIEWEPAWNFEIEYEIID
jgi:hypothetical protein